MIMFIIWMIKYAIPRLPVFPRGIIYRLETGPRHVELQQRPEDFSTDCWSA